MKIKIEKAIRETLVIENKQSIYRAVDKIMKYIDNEKPKRKSLAIDQRDTGHF